jgi:hypothetical protein
MAGEKMHTYNRVLEHVLSALVHMQHVVCIQKCGMSAIPKRSSPR